MANTKDDVLTTYTFECSYGDILTEEKPVIKAKKPGVYLHFLRYGLFDKNASEDTFDVNFQDESSSSSNKSTSKKQNKDQQHLIKVEDNTLERYSVELDNTNSQDSQNTETEKEITLNEVTIYSLKELPRLENFYAHPTSLNPGYLYIFDDNNDEDFKDFEFLIHADGSLQHIDWESKNNIDKNGNVLNLRTPASSNKVNAKRVHPAGKKLWVTYSPVQWTKEYHDKLFTDKELRKKRMKLVDCVPLKKDNPETNSNDESKLTPLSYLQVEAIYAGKNDPRAEGLYKVLEDIHEHEKLEDEKGENEYFEDLFFILHDPFSASEDISSVVDQKTVRFKGLVDSIQSGESISEAAERIAKGNLEVPRPKNDKGQPCEECEQLFTLALTCYQLIYNDDKAILKYDGGAPGWFNPGERHSLDPRPMYTQYDSHEYGRTVIKNAALIGYRGLDYQKLQGILGIDERNNARNTLLTYRDDLGSIVNCDYLKEHLDNYLDNHPERVVNGRNALLNIIDPLSFHPYKFDQHLMLQREYIKEDKWVNWLYKVIDDENCENTDDNGSKVKSESENFKGLDPALALLAAPLKVKELLSKKGFGFSQDLAGVYTKNFQYRAGQVANVKEINGLLLESIEDKQRFIVKKLNKIDPWDIDMFEIVDGDIRSTLEKQGVVLDPDYVQKGRYTGKRKEILRLLKDSHGDGFTYKTIKRNGRKAVAIDIKVARDLTDDAKIQKNIKISKLINGPAFNGLFAILEIHNFRNAYLKLSKDGSTREDKLKAISGGVKLIETSATFVEAGIKAFSKNPSRFLSGSVKVLGIVGGVIGAGWCFVDTFKAMDKGDMDSGLAMMGAGLAFSISTLAGAGVIFASTPVGWIAALVGVGFLIVASLLADKPLETYFKNFLLGDREAYPRLEGWSANYYTKQVLKNRKTLTDDDFLDTLMNPLDAQAKLFDYIVCKQISFTPIDTKTTTHNTGYMPDTIPINIEISKAYRFNAKMVFTRFFNHEDQVEPYAYFYPEGIKEGNPLKMKVKKAQKIYDQQGGEALQVEFSVSRKHRKEIRSSSEIMFALRLELDKDKKLHFPYPLGGKERFLGAKIKLRALTGAGLYQSSLDQNKETVFGTLAELKTKKPW